jgi:hypothetical protein
LKTHRTSTVQKTKYTTQVKESNTNFHKTTSLATLYPKTIAVNPEDFYVPSDDHHCYENNCRTLEIFEPKSGKRGRSARPGSAKHTMKVQVNDSAELKILLQKYKIAQQLRKSHRERTNSPNYARNTVCYTVKCM